MATVESLPDNIIVQILSYFPYPKLVKTGQVCKRWHRLCYDGSLWKEFNILEEHSEKLTNDVIERIVPCRNNFIDSIDLKNCRRIGDAAIQRIAVGCPRLKTLVLRGCDLITDKSVQLLARNTTTLERLEIPLENVSAETLSAVVGNNPELSELTAYSRAVTRKTLAMLAIHCDKLSKLVVLDAPLKAEEPSSSDVLTDGMVYILAMGCQRLKELTLHYNQIMLTDSALFVLAKKCRFLESLSVDYCDNDRGITDLGVCALAQRCKELKSLSLSNAEITDASLVFIAEHLRNIKELHLEFCQVSDVGVYSLLRKCGKLERLVVHSADNNRGGITDASAHIISHYNHTAFHSLGLGYANITDQGLRLICRQINLTSLSVSGCSAVGFDALEASFGDLSSLVYLDVSFTGIITKDEHLMQVGEALKNLTTLDITDCFGISKSGIKLFLEKFPKCKLVYSL